MKTIDTLGRPCPIPVIKAKKELAKPDNKGVVVLVDNIAAVQNLQKMANGLGYIFSYEQKDVSCYGVSILKAGASTPVIDNTTAMKSGESPVQTADGVTVLITNDQMGSGSAELGKILIKGFLFSLTELPLLPKTVIFLNAGVKLVAEGSNTVPDLQLLLEKGTEIYACGTCLNYYQLIEKVAVGEIIDMFGITNHLAASAKLITL
jgi:selenium metabolism protein YedF